MGDDLMADRHQRNLRRLFLGHAEIVVPDKTNRILISEPLRRYAGLQLSGDLVMVGTGQSIELWSTQRWEQVLTAAEESSEFFEKAPVEPTAATGQA
jgi:MraZ protein